MSHSRAWPAPVWATLSLLGAAWLAAPAPLAAEPVKLKLDPQHTTVGFAVRHIFTKVNGRFRQVEGAIVFDEQSPGASSVEVTIQAASIDTNVEARDKDLRSKRFFEVEKHPTITFKSSAVEPTGSGKARIRGVLAMHGVAREIVLDAEFLGKLKDSWGNLRYGFHAEATINRKDWGLTWNEVLETGAVLVGEEVQIILDAEGIHTG